VIGFMADAGDCVTTRSDRLAHIVADDPEPGRRSPEVAVDHLDHFADPDLIDRRID
jgi:hypothetical protein